MRRKKNQNTYTLFWKDPVVCIQKHTNMFLEIRQEPQRVRQCWQCNCNIVAKVPQMTISTSDRVSR